jgi:hypothetical protein
MEPALIERRASLGAQSEFGNSSAFSNSMKVAKEENEDAMNQAWSAKGGRGSLTDIFYTGFLSTESLVQR